MTLATIKTWLKENPMKVTAITSAITAAITGVLIACTSAGTPSPQVAAAEADLCKARAAWKLVALAAMGTLDPQPGTPRAELEAAEDALCRARAAAGPSASPPVTPAKDGGP